MLLNWDGLVKEARELCDSHGLPDVTKQDIHREDIKLAVMYYNLKTVKDHMGDLFLSERLCDFFLSREVR